MGGLSSQRSITATSSSSFFDFPLISGAQSRTTTTRRAHIMGIVSAASAAPKLEDFAPLDKKEQGEVVCLYDFEKAGKVPKPYKIVKGEGVTGGGGLVLSQGLDGSSVTGTINVVLDAATHDPFFVALRNNNVTDEEALRFRVMDNEGVTYYGSKTIPAAYKPNGTFVSMKNATLTGRLELQTHTETIDAAL